MNLFSIEIMKKIDSERNDIKRKAETLGLKKIKTIESLKIYHLKGNITENDAHRIAQEILTDPILENYIINEALLPESVDHIIETSYKLGVMNPEEKTIQKAIKDLISEDVEIRSSTRYFINGELSKKDISLLKDKILMNKILENENNPGEIKFIENSEFQLEINSEIEILNASDKELMDLSENKLWLTLEEMKTIQEIFKQLDRNPTTAELEQFAVSNSEHTCHKTFKTPIEYNGENIGTLMGMIKNVSNSLNKDWCLSIIVDNSGVITFDEDWAVCFKVETHNRPSALEPYGGASTGTGGVIRDILGTGLVAKPIANTDIFCFGPFDYPHDKLPKGILHPKRIANEVVAGVRDYGNRMGIPTVNGAVLFHEKYLGNPLVYCGTVGIMPIDKYKKGSPNPEDLIVLIGGKTGKDGIHGATFSSGELTNKSEDISSGAVQMPNAITEKAVLDALLKAREENLFNAITDCGAGGLSCAITEQGEDTGALVELSQVPLKYSGLKPYEIWISEAQERMILAVPKEKIQRLKEICDKSEAELSVLGTYPGDGKLKVSYNQEPIIDLEMSDLQKPLNPKTRIAIWEEPSLKEPNLIYPLSLNAELLKLLSRPNIRSKEEIVRQYDHEVQGGTVLRPTCGKNNEGPTDAAIIKPLGTKGNKAVIISNGINPNFGLIDPYWMAASVIDESLRQIIAVGGSMKQCAILDNFSWEKINTPEKLGKLVRCVQGCQDAAIAFGTPFISGKDSLNNEFVKEDGESICIPPTLLISAISIMDDYRDAVTMDFKKPGNDIYVIGETKDELGGSQYYEEKKQLGKNVPKVDFEKALETFNQISNATSERLIESCHDISDGGLAVAIAEMCIGSKLGAEIDLKKIPNSIDDKEPYKILFSESNSRFIVEIESKNSERFEEIMKNIICSKIGRVTMEKKLVITDEKRTPHVYMSIDKLKESWKKPLLED